MDLHFAAEFTKLLDLKLALAFCIHINFIPLGNIVLVFTNRTD